jgi:response regulator of citrate/malate metabolism
VIPDIRVLVVEDEPITASAHAEYVRRIDGFEVAGVVHDGHGTLRALRDSVTDVESRSGSIDLILLDMNLPDTNGIELCRRIRQSGISVDVIAVTAVRETRVVRSAVSLGIVVYLLKPFTFATFAEKMLGYLAFRRRLSDAAGIVAQADVDQSMASLLAPARAHLDKGLSEETLDSVARTVKDTAAPMSATELGAQLGLSRVTARRYLEHLAETGIVERAPRYGTPGRPELEYRRRGASPAGRR